MDSIYSRKQTYKAKQIVLCHLLTKLFKLILGYQNCWMISDPSCRDYTWEDWNFKQIADKWSQTLSASWLSQFCSIKTRCRKLNFGVSMISDSQSFLSAAGLRMWWQQPVLQCGSSLLRPLWWTSIWVSWTRWDSKTPDAKHVITNWVLLEFPSLDIIKSISVSPW